MFQEYAILCKEADGIPETHLLTSANARVMEATECLAVAFELVSPFQDDEAEVLDALAAVKQARRALVIAEHLLGRAVSGRPRVADPIIQADAAFIVEVKDSGDVHVNTVKGGL